MRLVLSRIEKWVLELKKEGKTIPEIQQETGLTPHTILRILETYDASEHMKILSFKAEQYLADWLEQISEKLGVSKSTIIRKALKQYLAKIELEDIPEARIKVLQTIDLNDSAKV